MNPDAASLPEVTTLSGQPETPVQPATQPAAQPATQPATRPDTQPAARSTEIKSESWGTETRRNIPRRIVIIGAVAAGTAAAAKARRNDESAAIVLYDKDEFISYSGCGLPYYIGGTVAPFELLVPRDAVFFKKKYNVDVFTRHLVMAVDPVAKTLTIQSLADGRLFLDHYDTLVLATGASAVVPLVPGVTLPHVFTLRSPGDARAIRRYLETGKPHTAAIIGSGFIGLEMVEALAHAGLAVSLVEKMPQVCPFVDPDMAPYLAEYLTQQGINVQTGASLTTITGTSELAYAPASVTLDNGQTLPADIVILAVGVRPNTTLAESIGVRLGPTRAIAVSPAMATNIPDVYACGDCAESFSIINGQPLYRPLGSTANKTGHIAGDVITGQPAAHRGIAGTGIFRVMAKTVAATGLSEQAARDSGYDIVISHNIKPDKPDYFGGEEMVIKTIADRSTGRLLGVQIIGGAGVDKRIDIFVTAMTAGLTAGDLFHLDLAYAPPFGTTRDPVHYSGMILTNIIERGRLQLTADELAATIEQAPESIQIIDTRSASQYAAGHIPAAINIPQEELRQEIETLDPGKPVMTYCNKGVTGNATQNILLNRGFEKVYSLSGGYRQFKACRGDRPEPPRQPDQAELADQPDRTAQAERPDQPGLPDQSARTAQADRPDQPE